MISKKESIPSKRDSYKLGEDVFYYQFNDVSFYVEDEDQENFFFCILKKLFPDIKLEKIFPLGGKDIVINESSKNVGDKKRIYIVDKDFDNILDEVIDRNNLFYLRRYSIENYLIEPSSLVQFVISEKPKLNIKDVQNEIELDNILNKIGELLKDIILLFILVQFENIDIKNVRLGHERFTEFRNGNFIRDENQVNNYKNKILEKLKIKDGRFTLNSRLRKLDFNLSKKNFLVDIPGKFLIKIIKRTLENKFGIQNRSLDSFNYRMAKLSEFETLKYLKTDIANYIKK